MGCKVRKLSLSISGVYGVGRQPPIDTLSQAVASPTDRRSIGCWREQLQVLLAHLRGSKSSVKLTFKMLKITFVSVLFKLSL